MSGVHEIGAIHLSLCLYVFHVCMYHTLSGFQILVDSFESPGTISFLMDFDLDGNSA